MLPVLHAAGPGTSSAAHLAENLAAAALRLVDDEFE
jgi:aryl-alcohol dehydrogenase-like predicted oxidoreductase